MKRLTIDPLKLSELKLIRRDFLEDDRGLFSRIFCSEELVEAGWKKPIAQINLTVTKKKGTLRGLHFQTTPFSEVKMVTCLRGKIWDVAIDLRKSSKTYLKWHAEILSNENKQSLIIPEGFAHGFQTLEDDCEVLYFHSEAYNKAYENGVHYLDPAFNIEWPLPVIEISSRDKNFSFINSSFQD